ncbi:UdgX family uracil-DNA binding protein [Legionella saoudiensis]|uniref:UdgX family uracil-DNA binding protein n=1 Tax=Legionella saoudiensis TaxID=1750561 RepID=UPI0007309EAA|nr:UdgX family uracil-DNA binding protein [Legionella saoudiensis]
MDKSASEFIPNTSSLAKLKEAALHCKGCDLYKHATQTVFGDGNPHAPLMLVGEQPGNKEDLEGKPFVGAAGLLLHQLVEELDLDEDLLYYTNSVKHFKFQQIGNRRQHRSPSEPEIRACHPWIISELKIVQPKVVLCLGATAAKSLINPNFHLQKERGHLIQEPSYQIMATYHPSAILRAKMFHKDKEIRATLKEDLLLAYETAH